MKLRSLLMFLFALVLVLSVDQKAKAGFCDPQFASVGGSSYDVSPYVSKHLNYLTRASIVCQMKDAFKTNYTGVDFKQRTLGLNIDSHLEQCARAEFELQDEVYNSAIDFFDRSRKCIAGIKDGHIFLGSPRSLQVYVTLGILIGKVDNKYYIIDSSEQMLSYATKELDHSPDDIKKIKSTLSFGNELIEINGVPTQQVVDELKPYISGGNNLSIEAKATKALTVRDFRFPREKYAVLKIKLRDKNESDSSKVTKKTNPTYRSIRLRWWITQEPISLEAKDYFQVRGIEVNKALEWTYDAKASKWQKNEEYYMLSDLERRTVVNGDYLKSYYKGPRPYLQMGIYLQELGVGFCYVKLNGFSARVSKTKSGSEDLNTIDLLKEQFQECSKAKLPLVLDFRRNLGGSNWTTSEFTNLLFKKGKVDIPVIAYRATENILNSLAVYAKPTEDVNLESGTMSNYYVNSVLAIEDAIRAKKEYTDFLIRDDYTDDNAYDPDLKILVLTSEQCISNCDVFSKIIKEASQRMNVRILGTPTAGGVFGYAYADEQMRPYWRDVNKFFGVNIPQTILTTAKMPESGDTIPYEDLINTLPENRPIQPNFYYENTMDDLDPKDKLKGWRKKIVEILFQTAW